jgi:lipoate-protein ligase A
LKEHWRLILQKDTSAAYGLAVDETTSLSVARNNSPPVLHLYNFLPCVVLGRYQSAEHSIDIDECRRQGLEINRRHTGGGTVMMGPKQLALGFSIPKDYPGVGPSINDIFKNLGGVLCKALASVGLKGRFRSKNDLEVGKKKIAGLSASLEERDVAFFHTSLLLDFDFKLMLKVFKLPIKKLADKHISCFTDRMTTVRREKRRRIDLPSFQSLVRKAFEEHFGVTFRIDTLNQWELDQLDLLLRRRYTNPEWIFSRRHPGMGVGFASAKTPGGLIELGVTLAGEVIEAAYLTGDFLSTSAEVNRIEAALRYCAATKTAIQKRLRKAADTDCIFKVKRDVIANLAVKAAQRARVERKKAQEEAEKKKKAEEERQRREVEAMRAAFTPPPPPPEEPSSEPEEEKKKPVKKTKAAKKTKPKKKKAGTKKTKPEKKKVAAKKAKKAKTKKTKAAVKKKSTPKKTKLVKKAKLKKRKPAEKKAKAAGKPKTGKKKPAVKKMKAAIKKTKAAKKKTAAKKTKPAKKTKAAKKKSVAKKKKPVAKKIRPAKKVKAALKKKTTKKKSPKAPRGKTAGKRKAKGKKR